MNDTSSTQQHDPVPGGDNPQRKKMTKKTRLCGFVLIGIGLFAVLAVPVMLGQKAAKDAESMVEHYGGSGGASAPWNSVLRGEAHTSARRNAEESRKLGFILVIAGIAVLALARNPTAMDFLAKQQRKQ